MTEPLQFYSPDDIAAYCGVTRDTVYRYHRDVRQREFSQPLPTRWPMEKPDAQRFIEYIKKRARKLSPN